MDQNRSLLFSDWDLEAIIKNLNATRDDDFSKLVSLVHNGQFEEASDWLQIETSHFPWILIISAYVQLSNGRTDEAGKSLRAVTLIAQDTLLQLWAWNNLAKLGKTPPATLAQQVMGIIIEVPYENGADTLASYADGTARYINHNGGMILWEEFDETITPLIYEGIKMAHPMGELSIQRRDSQVAEGDVRLTLLTPGGLHIWEGAPEDGSEVARLFAQQANLLRALVRIAMEKHDREE